jgi:hypothetical protein
MSPVTDRLVQAEPSGDEHGVDDGSADGAADCSGVEGGHSCAVAGGLGERFVVREVAVGSALGINRLIIPFTAYPFTA